MKVSPDTEHLALGRELDAAYADYLAFRPEELAAEDALQAAYEANAAALRDAERRGDAAVMELYHELGAPFDQVFTDAAAMRERADGPAEALFKLRLPATLAGLAVLARALAGFHVELWDDPLEELEIDERMLRLTVEATLALAGVDRVGRPAGASR
ncbi:hypothetical protein [Methylobacterium radiotolerans]|uniref:hypothetical protein n=1 Tax=Methylobacterium radiotolerans TaxID=31998 RepID=UPI001F304BB3|nr:hypothetical protein [Methylobacterium radiotolerans]UIY45854.1 hypothetical protein LZ599_32585 [Methylobacterium radiotolerans]